MSFPGSVLLSDAEIRNVTTTKRLPLGTRGYTSDGRAFRYALNSSTAIAIGKLVQQAVPDASMDADLDLCTSTLYANADYQDTNSSAVYIKPAATEVIAANVYQDGYLYVNDNYGEGNYVIVKDHLALDGTVSVVWKINFRSDSKLGTTLTTLSQVGLIQNKYTEVVVRPATARTGVPLGVTVRTFTASTYGWLQTWGPAVCHVILAAVAGAPLSDDTMTGTGTAGTIHKIATSTDPAAAGTANMNFGKFIGNALAPVATDEYCLVDLAISP